MFLDPRGVAPPSTPFAERLHEAQPRLQPLPVRIPGLDRVGECLLLCRALDTDAQLELLARERDSGNGQHGPRPPPPPPGARGPRRPPRDPGREPRSGCRTVARPRAVRRSPRTSARPILACRGPTGVPPIRIPCAGYQNVEKGLLASIAVALRFLTASPFVLAIHSFHGRRHARPHPRLRSPGLRDGAFPRAKRGDRPRRLRGCVPPACGGREAGRGVEEGSGGGPRRFEAEGPRRGPGLRRPRRVRGPSPLPRPPPPGGPPGPRALHAPRP